MNWCNREVRLEEMLADSIVRAVMEADGVDPRVLEAELRQTAAIVRAARQALKSDVRYDQKKY
jgi:hypothetical protein